MILNKLIQRLTKNYSHIKCTRLNSIVWCHFYFIKLTRRLDEMLSYTMKNVRLKKEHYKKEIQTK